MTKKSHGRVREPSSNHRGQQHQFIIVHQYDIAFLVLERDRFQILLIGLHEGLVQVRSTCYICR